MKTRSFMMSIFILTVFTFAAFGSTSGTSTFSGEVRFDPLGLLGAPVGTVLPSDVTVLCPGNEPTGDPFMPCPPGSRAHLRNGLVMSRFTSSTPEFPGGWFTEVINYNIAADFTGTSWGTFTLELDDGGVVTGRWQGVRYQVGNYLMVSVHSTGQTEGGAYDGATLVIKNQVTIYAPVAYIGQLEGNIVSYR